MNWEIKESKDKRSPGKRESLAGDKILEERRGEEWRGDEGELGF